MIDLKPIESIAQRVVDAYRKILADEGINASSRLSDSAEVEVSLNNTKLVISLMLEEYWKYVEYGRGPGKRPPIDAIENWIKVKPVIPDARNGKIPTQRQLAYLISRKIGWEGTPARHAINKTVYSDVVEGIINEIRNEIVRQLNQQLLGSEN